jgi:hypothetical protein
MPTATQLRKNIANMEKVDLYNPIVYLDKNKKPIESIKKVDPNC